MSVLLGEKKKLKMYQDEKVQIREAPLLRSCCKGRLVTGPGWGGGGVTGPGEAARGRGRVASSRVGGPAHQSLHQRHEGATADSGQAEVT